MATREQQIRLQKASKKKPCADGSHDEIIVYPTVPPEEEDVNKRVEAMKEAGCNKHEIDAALEDIRRGDITHGRQLSRPLKPSEKDGRNGDEQKVHALCVVCRKKREIDQAPNENSIVEAKDEASMKPRTRDQAIDNAAFSKQAGNKVTYKLPKGQVPRGWGKSSRPTAFIQIFRSNGARPPSFIPI